MNFIIDLADNTNIPMSISYIKPLWRKVNRVNHASCILKIVWNRSNIKDR